MTDTDRDEHSTVAAHTPGPWSLNGQVGYGWIIGPNIAVAYGGPTSGRVLDGEANARLIAAAPDLLAALHEARRAIGDHFAPNDCYATGPVTGNAFRDLIQCPACTAIAMYDTAITKATPKG